MMTRIETYLRAKEEMSILIGELQVPDDYCIDVNTMRNLKEDLKTAYEAITSLKMGEIGGIAINIEVESSTLFLIGIEFESRVAKITVKVHDSVEVDTEDTFGALSHIQDKLLAPLILELRKRISFLEEEI